MIFGKKWLEEKHRQYESQTWAKLSVMFRNFTIETLMMDHGVVSSISPSLI